MGLAMFANFCKKEGSDAAPDEEEGEEFGPAETLVEE